MSNTNFSSWKQREGQADGSPPAELPATLSTWAIVACLGSLCFEAVSNTWMRLSVWRLMCASVFPLCSCWWWNRWCSRAEMICDTWDFPMEVPGMAMELLRLRW